MQSCPKNLMPNVFGLRFGNRFIIGSQRKDESIWSGYISACRCPVNDRKRTQTAVYCGLICTDSCIRRFLRSCANSDERLIQTIRVTLKREMNGSVCFVLCGSRKIVLYRLLHNHGPETDLLIVADDGSQNSFSLLHGALRTTCLRVLTKRTSIPLKKLSCLCFQTSSNSLRTFAKSGVLASLDILVPADFCTGDRISFRVTPACLRVFDQVHRSDLLSHLVGQFGGRSSASGQANASAPDKAPRDAGAPMRAPTCRLPRCRPMRVESLNPCRATARIGM